MIQQYSYLSFQALSTEYSESRVQMEGHFAANSSEKHTKAFVYPVACQN